MKYLFTLLFFILSFFTFVESYTFRKHMYFKEEQAPPQKGRISQKKCYGSIVQIEKEQTKLNVYSWNCNNIGSIKDVKLKNILDQKITQGLSYLSGKTNLTSVYFTPLLNNIKKVIPSEFQASSPIALGATESLLSLSKNDQDSFLNETKKVFASSGLLFKGEWIRVITGKEQGQFLWACVNYLLKANQNNEKELIFSVVGLGSESTQIAFNIPPENKNIPSKNKDNKTKEANLEEINKDSFYSQSFLNFGNDKARDGVTQLLIKESKTYMVKHGCYNLGYYSFDLEQNKTIIGTSKPLECIESIRKYLNQTSCKPDQQFSCSINGTKQPKVPLNPFIAVSGISQAADSFKMKQPFFPAQLKEAALDFCKLDFQQIRKKEPKNKYIASKCFLGLYASILLEEGYNLANTKIFASDEINRIKPSWSVGYLFKIISDKK